MKYLHFMLLALVGLGAFSTVQGAPAPKMVCDEPVFEFGTRDSSETVKHLFVLRNEGDLSLEISGTRTSCGCTVAKLSSQIIRPGESVELEARLNLKGRTGLQAKTITVTSNDPKKPNLMLKLQGISQPSLEIKPTRLYLHNKSSSESSRATAEVISHTRKNLKLSDLICSVEYLHAELETVVEGEHYRVHVETVPPVPPGRFAGSVRMSSNDPDRPMISIGIMGSIIGEVAYAPEKILLSGKNTQPVTRYVAVRPGSFKDLKVASIDIPDPSIQVRVFELANNQGFRLQLANLVASPELNGKVLQIHTNVPSKPVIEIPFEILP